MAPLCAVARGLPLHHAVERRALCALPVPWWPAAHGRRALSTSAAVPPTALRVAFFGGDAVSLASLRKLHESLTGGGAHPGLVGALDVVCPSDRPAGRGQKLTTLPVAEFARAHGLREVNVPYGLKSLREWHGLDSLRAGSPQEQAQQQHTHDVGVVVSFGYFMPPHVLAAMGRGSVNMHPSLLPKYRGAAPIPHAILGGDAVTGVSIIELHPAAFDAGRVLDQVAVPIEPDEGCASLTSRLAEVGADRLLGVLARLPAAQASAWRQDDADATRAPKLRPADGLVRWDDASACSVEALLRRWRALDATSYGLHTHAAFGGGGKPAAAAGAAPPPKRVRLLELTRLQQAALPAAVAAAALAAPPPPPGTLVYDKPSGVLAVRASDGWLRLGRLHVETRAPLSGREFANGYRIGAATGHRFELVRPEAAAAPTGA